MKKKKTRQIKSRKKIKREVPSEAARAAKAAHDQDIVLPRVRDVVDLVQNRENAGRDLAPVPVGGHALVRDQSREIVERDPAAGRKRGREAVTDVVAVVLVLGTFQ